MSCLVAILHVFFTIIVPCFYLSPQTFHFHVIDVQRDPAISSSLFPTPPISSSCLDANEEIDLQATESSGCWSL